eukprot:1003441_1
MEELDCLRCFICFGRVQEACLCPSCSKMCCKPCITKWITERKPECPHCRTTLHVSDLVPFRSMEEICEQIEKLQTQQSTADREMCKLHEMSLMYFCVSCKEAICSDCAMFGKKHSGHEFEKLDNMYLQSVNSLKEEIARIHSRLDQLTNLEGEIEENIARVKNVKESRSGELRAALDEMESVLSAQLKAKLVILLGQKNELLKESNVLDSVARELECHLDTRVCPRADLVLKSAKMHRMLQQIHRKPVSHFFREPVSSSFPSELIPPFCEQSFALEEFDERRRNDDVVFSPPLEVNGLCWRLKVYPGGNGSARGAFVSVFLELSSSGFSGSSRYEYRVEMMNHTDPDRMVSRTFASDFEVGECWGYNRFFRIDMLESDGFLSPEGTLLLNFYVRSSNYAQLCRDQGRYIQKLSRKLRAAKRRQDSPIRRSADGTVEQKTDVVEEAESANLDAAPNHGSLESDQGSPRSSLESKNSPGPVIRQHTRFIIDNAASAYSEPVTPARHRSPRSSGPRSPRSGPGRLAGHSHALMLEALLAQSEIERAQFRATNEEDEPSLNSSDDDDEKGETPFETEMFKYFSSPRSLDPRRPAQTPPTVGSPLLGRYRLQSARRATPPLTDDLKDSAEFSRCIRVMQSQRVRSPAHRSPSHQHIDHGSPTRFDHGSPAHRPGPWESDYAVAERKWNESRDSDFRAVQARTGSGGDEQKAPSRRPEIRQRRVTAPAVKTAPSPRSSRRRIIKEPIHMFSPPRFHTRSHTRLHDFGLGPTGRNRLHRVSGHVHDLVTPPRSHSEPLLADVHIEDDSISPSSSSDGTDESSDLHGSDPHSGNLRLTPPTESSGLSRISGLTTGSYGLGNTSLTESGGGLGRLTDLTGFSSSRGSWPANRHLSSTTISRLSEITTRHSSEIPTFERTESSLEHSEDFELKTESELLPGRRDPVEPESVPVQDNTICQADPNSEPSQRPLERRGEPAPKKPSEGVK